MTLQAEQYEQIIAGLRSERNRARGCEHRSSPRVGMRMKVSVIPCRTGVRARMHEVWLRDISATGVAFVFPEAMAVGAYAVIVLPRAGGSTLNMLFAVTRCHRLSSGQFCVGAKLNRVITSDDLR